MTNYDDDAMMMVHDKYSAGNYTHDNHDDSHKSDGNLSRGLQAPIMSNEQYGYDQDEPSPRGEEHTYVINFFTRHLFRIGLSLQLFSLVLMQILYKLYDGGGIFIFDVYMVNDVAKLSKGLNISLIVLTLIYIYGTVSCVTFQAFVADNSKFSRGFRIGSKYMGSALLLDLISACFRLAQYYYAYKFQSLKWWAKHTQTTGDWSILHLGNMLNASSLIIFGAACFYMESYHDEGTDEKYSWILLLLYSLSGLAELMMIFSSYGSFFALLQISSVIAALIWSSHFEPLLQKYTPPLHSRDLNADVMPDCLVDAPYGYYDVAKSANQNTINN